MEFLAQEIHTLQKFLVAFTKSTSTMLAQFCAQMLSHVWLFVTPWTVAHQAPLSMGFSRQEYWSGLPFPSSGDLPQSGIKTTHKKIFKAHRWCESSPYWHRRDSLWLQMNLRECIWGVLFPKQAAGSYFCILGLDNFNIWEL